MKAAFALLNTPPPNSYHLISHSDLIIKSKNHEIQYSEKHFPTAYLKLSSRVSTKTQNFKAHQNFKVLKSFRSSCLLVFGGGG